MAPCAAGLKPPGSWHRQRLLVATAWRPPLRRREDGLYSRLEGNQKLRFSQPGRTPLPVTETVEARRSVRMLVFRRQSVCTGGEPPQAPTARAVRAERAALPPAQGRMCGWAPPRAGAKSGGVAGGRPGVDRACSVRQKLWSGNSLSLYSAAGSWLAPGWREQRNQIGLAGGAGRKTARSSEPKDCAKPENIPSFARTLRTVA